jgi:transposase
MERFYLGIDVSKGYADSVIIDKNKKIVEHNFQFDDTHEGQNKYYSLLKKFTEDHPNSEILAAVESTGGYENNWYNFLCKFRDVFNIQIARLNPAGVYFNRKADLKRIVTDKESANSVAEYLISHQDKVTYDNENIYTDLRKQYKFVSMLIKQKVQLENQLETLLYSANPELMPYCKNGKPQWILKLLQKYPTAERLSKARAASLAKIPYITIKRAEELLESAKSSVASYHGFITENIIKATVEQIMNLIDVIDEQEKMMSQHCDLLEVKLLQSIGGIGISSAVGLILEIGGIERFLNSKKLASYFGIHPVFKQSGDGTTGMHMSKQGRRAARAILFMAAKSAAMHNEIISEYHQKLMKSGMSYLSAIGACMHKLLRIIYGVLKNKTEFNPTVYRNNQEKVKNENVKIPQNKDRRFQKYDPKAPISRRQVRKRKAIVKSQNINDIKYEIKLNSQNQNVVMIN